MLRLCKARKREMEDELNSFREAKQAVEAEHGSSDGSGAGTGSSVSNNVRDAEQAFDRALRGGWRKFRVLAEPRTSTQLRNEPNLSNLHEENRIKERLQAFRSKSE